MRRMCVAATCAVLALAAAACGEDEDASKATAGPVDAAYGDDGANGAEATAGTRVKMVDSQFSPTALRVKVGDTVTFENTDALGHTATGVEGARFDSADIEPGSSYEWEAAKAGEIRYVCDFHPGMKGTITVD